MTKQNLWSHSLGMLKNDSWLLQVIGSEEQEAQFKKGIGDEVGVLLELLFIADDELKAFLSLQWGVHVSQAWPLH